MSRYLLFLTFGIFLGCGGGSFSSVSGTVTLDGKPLAGASVQFVPQGSGRDATGGTDRSGYFVMSTNEPGDGVVPGSYKVVISPPRDEVDKTQYATSGDAMNAPAKAPPKKASGPTVPEKFTRPDLTPLTQEVPTKGSLKFDLKSTDK
jgi:hypothetical protein